MIEKLDLSGSWSFCLDKEKAGLKEEYYKKQLEDNIYLPTTVSEAKKGTPSTEKNTYFLTDPYLFEGYTWYSREVEFPSKEGKEFYLVLERTRTSHVWIDNNYIGTQDSLCTSHRYRLTDDISSSRHKLTILIDNTSCPVKGGHMTSQDTQTNWNGITGGIHIEVYPCAYLDQVKITGSLEKRLIYVKAMLHGSKNCTAKIFVIDQAEGRSFKETFLDLKPGENNFTYELDPSVKPWSEHSPYLYTLQIELLPEDVYCYPFGLRAFQASGIYFHINGMRTFLRGKHDGLIFPITGYAPTDLKSWLDVFTTAKSYGINHYRFHTCCPPEAAFTAADMLGIYLEPELPFWGTVTDESYEDHDKVGQEYLIREGFRILDEFGNHPSFVMMSLGNELWGSKERLNKILGLYKAYDNRHLYTQGSNNFQFAPCILEEEDFFCGVRFGRERLFRGSYAMCDAPQGHIQTQAPDMLYNYDDMIRPRHAVRNSVSEGGAVTIQYGTGVKTVKAEETQELLPMVPVVSHEIGQYAMYPDYSELDRYTGVLKPYNLKAFRERIEKAGMLLQADQFFRASGRFAVECYKAELETALRSSELAGFQLLDLQDFTGQGTALVGILNAFMDSKGLIREEEWREFCSDTVLLAELPKLVYASGESVRIGIKLAHFNPVKVQKPKIKLKLSQGEQLLLTEELSSKKSFSSGVHLLGEFLLQLPMLKDPGKVRLTIDLSGTDVTNHYDLWIYPLCKDVEVQEDLLITEELELAAEGLKEGRKVLYFPHTLDDTNSIEGTYCTDFWCYPMFRSISESMNKPVPIGTLGLSVEVKHPVFEGFPTEYYTTAQWYDIISNSRVAILDETPLKPILWMIDNFERNHKLGLLFEASVGTGRLFVCTADLRKLGDCLPAKWLYKSILEYMVSDRFKPEQNLSSDTMKHIFKH